MTSASPLYADQAYDPMIRAKTKKANCMADLILIVLGTGGILLMAAYAELCDRI